MYYVFLFDTMLLFYNNYLLFVAKKRVFIIILCLSHAGYCFNASVESQTVNK